MNNIKRILFSIFVTAVLLGLAACNLFHPPLPPSTAENLAPETHISFFYNPDTTLGPGDYWINNGDTVWIADNDTLIVGLDTTVSVQEVHWWGDDPDGNVIGYYYRWSYMDTAIFTQDESAIFYLPLRTQFDIYSLHVQAVDNDSLLDPTAAVVSFPVFNSPPEIEWKLNSLPQSTITKDSVHISFQHHSFYWDVYDLDGDETITDIFYSIDDTSSWQRLDGETRQKQITDLTPGNHRIYIKAKDIAGSESNIISFPKLNDPDEKIKTWFVQEPIGDILIVNDFSNDQLDFEQQNYYKTIFNDLVGSTGYSVWEIGQKGSDYANSANIIPYSQDDIELNLRPFSKVFWYTYYSKNSINESTLALTRFVLKGGTLFLCNAQVYDSELPDNIPDTNWTFTDFDSTYLITGRMESGAYDPNKAVYIESLLDDTTKNNLLKLKVDQTIGKLFSIVPGSTSKLIYQVEPTENNTSNYPGNPPVMIESTIGNGKSYYMSLPLYLLKGNDNLDELFKYVFEIDG